MRRGQLLMAVALASAFAGPGAARAAMPPVSSNPSGRQALAPMTDLPFTARIEGDVRLAMVSVARSPEVAPTGEFSTDTYNWFMERAPFSQGLYRAHLPALAPMRFLGGTYWWQVRATIREPDGTSTVVFGSPVRLELYFPASWSRRTRIDRRFGRQGSASFFLSTQDIPAGVSRARFATIMRTSARRWGLRVAGWTDRRARVRDRVNVAGFGPGVPGIALAVQSDLYSVRVRVFRRCRSRGGQIIPGSCGPIQRQRLGRVLTDQDLLIREDVNWNAGPARPAEDEADLETVVIHELGHLAGNKRHAKRCGNTPMAPALRRGDWWRTPHDWFRRGCPLQAPASLL